MGNESAKPKRNKNSFSVDFGHQKPDKIKPNNQFKLEPILPLPTEGDTAIIQNGDRSNNRVRSEMRSEMRKPVEEASRQNTQRLNKLNLINDELRKELIKISTELTTKLKKKKFTPKAIKSEDQDHKKRSALKRELDHAYKQIDMYKRTIEELKNNDPSERTDEKLTGVQNKIGAVDIDIELIGQEIQAIKNVTVNQSQGMKRDKVWDTLDQLKGEAEAVRLRLREMGKEGRKREKKYMDQHHYMINLERKLRELNGQYVPELHPKNPNKGEEKQKQKQKVDEVEMKQAEDEIEILKIKHDQYHKKINSLLLSNKQLKETKGELKDELQEKKKQIEGLKYKRDALVKQIKDNLYLFATRHQHDDEDEELSEFQSEEEEEITPIQEEEDQRGTFDVEHLKDHTLKSKPKDDKEVIIPEQTIMRSQQPKQQPKQWKKRLTRIVEKGKQVQGEKLFKTGISKIPKKDMKIVMMNVWMTKKKQITAIQPIYLIDGDVYDGEKSSKNVEDEYRVTYQLDEHDFLKSVLGIFGKNGFLEYLVLQSHFGKISRIGRSQTDGDNFAVGVAKEETPIQIVGANSFDGTYWRINRLQFEILIESG